jgi:hypothetical protein
MRRYDSEIRGLREKLVQIGIATYHYHDHNAVVGNDHIDKYDPFSKEIIKPKGDIKVENF